MNFELIGLIFYSIYLELPTSYVYLYCYFSRLMTSDNNNSKGKNKCEFHNFHNITVKLFIMVTVNIVSLISCNFQA